MQLALSMLESDKSIAKHLITEKDGNKRTHDGEM